MPRSFRLVIFWLFALASLAIAVALEARPIALAIIAIGVIAWYPRKSRVPTSYPQDAAK